jgi:hypothetical protein
MTTSDERIANAIELLGRIAQDIKSEWRAERDAQARRSNRGLLDVNTMMPIKTEGGRLVGYAFPNEAITVHETRPNQNPIKPPYILLRTLRTGDALPGQTKFLGDLVTPEGMTLEVHGTYQEVI